MARETVAAATTATSRPLPSSGSTASSIASLEAQWYLLAAVRDDDGQRRIPPWLVDRAAVELYRRLLAAYAEAGR